MGWHSEGLALTVLAVLVVTWLVQLWWCEREEQIAWNALSSGRILPKGQFHTQHGERHLQHGPGRPSTPEPFIQNIAWAEKKTWAHMRKRHAGHINAFVWVDSDGLDQERKYWNDRAAELRHSFLKRTQETAEKWRTIFGALLGIFGSILLIKPSLPQGATELPSGAYELVIFALAFGVQAVAYTGWAAAGLPKMLVNVDAETAFHQETTYGARSIARLRLGLIMGGVSALMLIGVAAALL